jgi:hypothetical protein
MVMHIKVTLESAIFCIGKLTIIGAACLNGTPFFLVCVLIKTSSLRGGRPSFLPYKCLIFSSEMEHSYVQNNDIYYLLHQFMPTTGKALTT